jgi:hypothetical protein
MIEAGLFSLLNLGSKIFEQLTPAEGLLALQFLSAIKENQVRSETEKRVKSVVFFHFLLLYYGRIDASR